MSRDKTIGCTMDNLESGALETSELLSIPGMREKLTEGKKTPLSECVPESEVDWSLVQVDADDVATEDDLMVHRVAIEEYVNGETIPHDAINWD